MIDKDTLTDRISAWVEVQLQNNGITAKKLAEISRISEFSVGSYRRKECVPSLLSWVKVCQALRKDPAVELFRLLRDD